MVIFLSIWNFFKRLKSLSPADDVGQGQNPRAPFWKFPDLIFTDRNKQLLGGASQSVSGWQPTCMRVNLHLFTCLLCVYVYIYYSTTYNSFKTTNTPCSTSVSSPSLHILGATHPSGVRPRSNTWLHLNLAWSHHFGWISWVRPWGNLKPSINHQIMQKPSINQQKSQKNQHFSVFSWRKQLLSARDFAAAPPSLPAPVAWGL